MINLSVIILAAGNGVRMHSTLPKVLQPIAGVPILERMLLTVSQLNPKQVIVVHGEQGDQLKNTFVNHKNGTLRNLDWINQKQPLGTGDAVRQALPSVAAVERVLILYGDTPLITNETLSRLLEATQTGAVGFITVEVVSPTGFGRIVRNAHGKLVRVVEEKNATIEEKKIKEINAGFFVVPKSHLQKWLPQLTADNTQQEYCLPDIIAMAHQDGVPIVTLSPQYAEEVEGVNDKMQLARLERLYQQLIAAKLMQQGVLMLDPARFDLRGELAVGKDVVIDVNVIIEGKVKLGDRVKLGPNVYLKDTVIESGAEIFANSMIEGATIGADCHIGPFARIRPGTVLAKMVHIGNFVEVKNSTIAEKSKANHLSYLGDATIGKEVNVGAGTITCNYDGKKKHKTIIEDGAFIGSDTQLIAPVTVGTGATIGAGTTVSRDVPAHALVHNRLERKVIADWKASDEES
jgi:bifunctional UDP-N-acetylglucosamine pyrophosphorylase/glucosamine-1-phosphate N-acetyltransferase